MSSKLQQSTNISMSLNSNLNHNNNRNSVRSSHCSSNQQPHHDNKCKKIMTTISVFVPARVVLYFLSWSGFLVSFMMRNDINLALVAMVRNPPNESFIELSSSNVTTTAKNVSLIGLEFSGEFDWDSTVQSIILGSFYWCYVLSQVIGGIATQYFGTKNVFGWSQFATAICSLTIPYAANLHYGVLVFVRSIQGFASGLTWPAMYAIVGYWIPPHERSRFMSSFQGFSIGIGLTYPLCGFIIANFGWHYVFYTTGTIGLFWCILWYFLAFNLPSTHPRITQQELDYIEVNVSQEIKDGHGMKVPWKKIFTSLPVWSIGVTTFGRIWIHYTFIMYGPVYMKQILGFNIQKNGVLSGLPFLCSYVSSVLFCYIADLLQKHNLLTLTNIRKLFTSISQIIPGLLIFLIGYLSSSSNIVLVLIIWFIAVTLITASYAGAMANIVDLAPNLAGPVLAFAQTIHMTASFVSPLISGIILKDQKNMDQWQLMFGIACFVAITTYIMFQLYGTADIQPWNYPKRSKSDVDTNEDSVMLSAEDNKNDENE